jgi:hypothetical protein
LGKGSAEQIRVKSVRVIEGSIIKEAKGFSTTTTKRDRKMWRRRSHLLLSNAVRTSHHLSSLSASTASRGRTLLTPSSNSCWAIPELKHTQIYVVQQLAYSTELLVCINQS